MGHCYGRSSFKSIAPDLVTVYRPAHFVRQYRLTHWIKKAFAVIPRFSRATWVLYGPQNVILGGFSPRIDISAATPYEESFLIFADKPFWLICLFIVAFRQCDGVGFDRREGDALSSLNMDDYDQVVFAFSVDSFINRPVAKGAAFLVNS
jgi:hypothetical protein